MMYKNLTELIGNTPLIELGAYCRNRNLKGKIFAKVEYFNPASSVKDRAAFSMITDAESRGLLKKGGVVIEPTSGNTGVGLAWICALRGYKMILTMPDSMSKERIKLAKAYGAQVVLTEGAKGMKGAIEKAYEMAANINGAFIPDQFNNQANADAHRKTTAKELLKDTDGKIDYFVAGVGSGGTLTGVGEILKNKIPEVKIIAVEPASSPLLSKGTLGKHKIQGIGANFIPSILNRDIIDEIIAAEDDNAIKCARLLASTEGLLCGFSSGAALYAAEAIASRPDSEGKNIVVILPDGGERYLSTDLYSD